jgi:hypothetical protein
MQKDLATAAFLAVSLSAACSNAPVVGSPSPDASTSYVVRLGSDTVALERFSRAGNRIESALVVRSPSTFVVNSNIEMGGNGLPVSWRIEQRLANGMRPNNGATATITFGRDSSTYVVTRDTGAAVTTRIPVGAAIPALGNSMLTQNLAIAYAKLQSADSVDVPVIGTNGRRGTPIPVRKLTSDSIRLWYFGDPIYAKLDTDGQIRWYDASHTTNKIQGIRSARIDLAAMATAYAARDAAGNGLGATTPRDTARAQIQGSAIWIDYGRPSLRGRNVWVNGVLGDTLWRTGGNGATQIQFANDIRIGGQTIPAGKYSLWTHISPGNTRYELIINRRTGQWGTDLPVPAQDVVRVPLTERTMPNSAERFTFTIEPSGNGGVIAMQWGTKRLEVPFTIVR